MGACWNPAELSMGEIQGMKKAELVEALLDYFEEELGRRPPLRYSAFLQKQRVSRLRRMLGERLHPQSYPEYRTRAAPTTGGRENPAELSLHEIQGMKKAELVKAILSFTQAPIVMGKGAKAYLQKQRVSKLQRMLALHLHPHAERYRRERYAAWGNPKKPISRMTKKEIIEALLLYAPNLDVVYLAKQRVGSLRDLMKKAEAWERSSPARKMSPRLKAVLRRKRQDYIDRYGHPPPVRARKNPLTLTPAGTDKRWDNLWLHRVAQGLADESTLPPHLRGRLKEAKDSLKRAKKNPKHFPSERHPFYPATDEPVALAAAVKAKRLIADAGFTPSDHYTFATMVPRLGGLQVYSSSFESFPNTQGHPKAQVYVSVETGEVTESEGLGRHGAQGNPLVPVLYSWPAPSKHGVPAALQATNLSGKLWKEMANSPEKRELILALAGYLHKYADFHYLARLRVGTLRDLLKKAEEWSEFQDHGKKMPSDLLLQGHRKGPFSGAARYDRLRAANRAGVTDSVYPKEMVAYLEKTKKKARKNARPAWRWGAGDPESHALGGRLPNAPREAVERFAEVRDIGESVKDLQFQLSRVQGKKQKHERQRSDLRRAIDSANRDLESVQREVRDEILEKYDYDKSDKVGNQAATALRSVFFQSVRSNPVNYHIEDRWMANPSRRPPLRLFGGGGRKKRTSCTELERRRLEHELKVCASFVPQHPPPISVRMAANPSVFERWGGMGQQTAFTGTGGTIKQLIAARSWFLPFSLGGVDDPEMGESVVRRIIGEISDEPKRRRDIAKELREEEADRVRVSDYYSRLKPKQDAYLKDHYPQFSGLLLGY